MLIFVGGGSRRGLHLQPSYHRHFHSGPSDETDGEGTHEPYDDIDYDQQEFYEEDDDLGSLRDFIAEDESDEAASAEPRSWDDDRSVSGTISSYSETPRPSRRPVEVVSSPIVSDDHDSDEGGAISNGRRRRIAQPRRRTTPTAHLPARANPPQVIELDAESPAGRVPPNPGPSSASSRHGTHVARRITEADNHHDDDDGDEDDDEEPISSLGRGWRNSTRDRRKRLRPSPTPETETSSPSPFRPNRAPRLGNQLHPSTGTRRRNRRRDRAASPSTSPSTTDTDGDGSMDASPSPVVSSLPPSPMICMRCGRSTMNVGRSIASRSDGRRCHRRRR